MRSSSYGIFLEALSPRYHDTETAHGRVNSRGSREMPCRNVKRFRGGLVFAHKLLYHSTVGLRVIKKEEKDRRAKAYLGPHQVMRRTSDLIRWFKRRFRRRTSDPMGLPCSKYLGSDRSRRVSRSTCSKVDEFVPRAQHFILRIVRQACSKACGVRAQPPRLVQNLLQN